MLKTFLSDPNDLLRRAVYISFFVMISTKKNCFKDEENCPHHAHAGVLSDYTMDAISSLDLLVFCYANYW